MKLLKASTAFLTLTALLLNGPYGIPVSDAQTTGANTTTANANVPNYTPSNMSAALGLATSNLTDAMAACGPTSLAGNKDLQGLAVDAISGSKSKSKKTAASTKSGGDCYKASAKTAFACDMTCAEPSSESGTASCEDFGFSDSNASNPNSTKQMFSGSQENLDLIISQKNDVQRYIDFMMFKAGTCVGKTMEDVKAQYDIYQCQMKALSSAVQQASSQLQAALTQNNQNFQKMTQFTKQVGDQMSQIDEILGPDPTDPNAKGGGGSQFQGLLGVQKILGEQLNQWTGNEATFKTSVDQIVKDTSTNDQTLEADRMAQVTDCMKGNTNLGVSGGRSLTCYKPLTQQTKDAQGQMVSTPALDSSGNVRYSKQACGALEYVRSQLEQAPLKQINNSSHQAKSQEYTLEFDSMVNSMMRDMGSYDAATADGKLVGRSTSWSDLQKKYSADMQDLSAKTGVNVMAQMNSVANSCYTASDNWKKQQLRSSASTYNKKKSEIDANKNKLNAQLTQGLSDMNKEYGSAMSILTNGQALSIDRSSCTNNDPQKMSDCYSNIKGKLQNIMDGTGAVGTTTKSIAGGSMLASFSVSCKGINGCVTTYQNVRKMKKDQLKAGQKATEDFVNNGNAQIQSQLLGFAQYLGTLQGQVNAQFGNMQSLLGKLGVESDAKPNYMNAEQLQPAKGPNGEMGPFESPKSMAGVLSGMVQPTGLMNFQDHGAQDILKSAQKKVKEDKADIAEKIKSHSSDLKKLAALTKSCKVGSSIAVTEVDSDQACAEYDACVARGDIEPTTANNSFQDILEAYQAYTDADKGKDKSEARTKLNGSIGKLKTGADGKCQWVLNSCRLYSTGKTKVQAYVDAKDGSVGTGYKGNN